MLFGFGSTGEEVLRDILQRWPLYRPAVQLLHPQALLLTDTQVDSNINFEFVRCLQIDAVGDRVRVFDKNHQQVEQMIAGIRQTMFARKGERNFLVGSLSEREIGLVPAVLKSLRDPIGGQVSLPELFLVIRSPDEQLLNQERFAAVREIIQALYEGGHLSNSRLLQRVYLFDGSGDRQDFARTTVSFVAEAILTFITGGISFSGIENSTLNPSDGRPAVRTIRIRSAIKPVMEQADYFAWRYLWDLWKEERTLLPAFAPNQGHISSILQKPNKYERYLQSWLGESVASWLFKPDQGQPPAVNEEQAMTSLLKGVTNLLADEKISDRFAVLGIVLKFVEKNAGSNYALLRKASIQCQNGLQYWFQKIPDFEGYFENKVHASRERLLSRASGLVIRWVTVSDAVMATTDQRYIDLMTSAKEQLFASIEKRTELEYRVSGDKIIWNMTSPFQTNDLGSNYKAFWEGIYQQVQASVLNQLDHQEQGWNSFNHETLDFLSGAWRPLVNQPPTVRHHYFLLEPTNVEQNGGSASTQYNLTIRNVTRLNKNVLTGLSVFTGLNIITTGDISRYSTDYDPQEKSHTDGLVRFAAYFEALLPTKLLRDGGLYCEDLIDTLRERNIPIAFFEVYFAGLLAWENRRKSWVISDFPGHKEIQLLEYQTTIFSQSSDELKKDIASLWLAYYRFAVEIPSTLHPGASFHDLHEANRSKYLGELVAYARRKGRKEIHLRWLDEQGERFRKVRLLYDFYRLGKAVQAISPENHLMKKGQ